MSTPRPPGALGDELTNLLLALLVGVAVLAAILRFAGSIAAFLTGIVQPRAGVTAGVTVLLHPSAPATALDAPGLHPVIYWIVAVLLIAGVVGLAYDPLARPPAERGPAPDRRDRYPHRSRSCQLTLSAPWPGWEPAPFA